MAQKNDPWYVKIIFWFQKRTYGHVLNSALIWAQSPRVFLALSFLYASLDRSSSPLPRALRTLVIVRVSQLNSCSFCIDLNTAVLIKRGVSLEKVEALSEWRLSPLFDEREKIALEYAEAVTDSNRKVSTDLNHRVNTLFASKERVELTALIAFQNMSTKFNNAYDLKPQGFCSLK